MSIKVTLIMILFLIWSADVYSASKTLLWAAPVTDADGSPIGNHTDNGGTVSDLAGYIVHYGITSGNYSQSIDVGNVTQYVVTGLTAGATYYFAVSAYDTSGNESVYSNELALNLGEDTDTTISLSTLKHRYIPEGMNLKVPYTLSNSIASPTLTIKRSINTDGDGSQDFPGCVDMAKGAGTCVVDTTGLAGTFYIRGESTGNAGTKVLYNPAPVTITPCNRKSNHACVGEMRVGQ